MNHFRNQCLSVTITASSFARRKRVTVLALVCLLAGVDCNAQDQTPQHELTPKQQERLKVRDEFGNQTAELREQGKLVEAIAAAKKMLAIEREVLGNDHEDTLGSLEQLAEMEQGLENFPAARKARIEILTSRTKVLGRDHWQTTDAKLALATVEQLAKLSPAQRRQLAEVDQLGQQVLQLQQEQKFSEAMKLARQIVQTKQTILGRNHRDCLDVLRGVAQLCVAQRDFEQAESLLKEILEVQQRTLGDEHPEYQGNLNDLAQTYREAGQPEKAVALLTGFIKAGEEKFGADDARVASRLHRLSNFYFGLERYDDAKVLLLRASRIVETKLGPKDPELALILHNLAMVYRSTNQLSDSEATFKRALKIWVATRTDNDHDTTLTKHELASTYALLGQHALAEPLLQQSLKVWQDSVGWQDPLYQNALLELIIVHERLQQPAEIKSLLQELIDVAENQPPESYAPVVDSLHTLATFLLTKGRPTESLTLLLSARRILESCAPTDSRLSVLLTSLGRAYEALRKLGDAEDAYQQALRFAEKEQGADHLDVADCLHILGFFYQSTGQIQRAVPLIRRAAQICEARLPPNDLKVAEILNRMAVVLMSATQQSEEPIALLERVVKIYEERLPENRPDLARSLGNLAMAYHAQPLARDVQSVDWKRAVELLRRAIKMYEEVYGAKHRDLAPHVRNLGYLLYEDPKQRDEAESFFRRALGIVESVVDPDNFELAGYLKPVAEVCQLQGKLAEATALYERCLTLQESGLPPWHPTIASQLLSLSRVYAEQKQWDKVVQTFDRLHRSQRLHLNFNLPVLTPPQQLAYLQKTHENCFHTSLSLLPLLPRDENLVVRSAEWVINGKSIAQQVRAEEILLARESSDPRAPEIARQLLQIRAELATLTSRRFFTGREEAVDAQKSKELERQQAALAAQLDVGLSRLKRADPWVNLESVRAHIPEEAVLVELVDFDLWDFGKGAWKELPWDEDKRRLLPEAERRFSCFGAWIIPPTRQGPVRFVDLGDSDELRKLIASYQSKMKSALRKIDFDEGEAETDIRIHLKAIADRTLALLQKHISNFKRWLISPDESLWTVPWAALPLSDGTYALEKHSISYLVSGRDLIPASASSSATGTPGRTGFGSALIIGNPDFDLSATETHRIVQQSIPRDRLRVRGPSSEEAERVGRDWGRLFGTENEIRGIRSKVATFAKVEPEIHTDANALESFVKAAECPKVLILATHGFLLQTLNPLPKSAPAAPREGMIPLIAPRKFRYRIGDLELVEFLGDPLVRCGLVFAGANKRNKEDSPTADDGVLTGMEVLGCNLRGTKLVVLSACDTGLGDVNAGEGVSGLRQAFQLAGAESVVASLWKVSDDESVNLMTMFWENLAAGQGRADALRNAQLTFIKERRAKEKAAHPFFWAAFTLTGAWE